MNGTLLWQSFSSTSWLENRPMASLKDVASAAGVSISTVSRALGQSSHPVSPELRERVQRVARQVGYQPNPLGRALISMRLPLIGAIVHDIRDSYQCEILRGVEDSAVAAGYFVVVCNTDRDRARELAYVGLLVSYRATGIVFIPSGVDDPAHNAAVTAQLQRLAANGGHAVATAPTPLLIPRIAPDNRGGAREVAAHLLARAHGPVLVLGGERDKCATTERLAGFADAFSSRGLEIDERLMLWGDDRRDRAGEVVEMELRKGTDFRAVLATNDEMAVGALLAMESTGIKVPQQVLVAGFGDMTASRLVRPQITTAEVPTTEIGRLAAQLIVDASERRTMPEASRVVPARLLARASTGDHAVQGRVAKDPHVAVHAVPGAREH